MSAKGYKQSSADSAFLCVLRFALDTVPGRGALPTDVDWEAVYVAASRQAVVGVVAGCIGRLPEGERPKGQLLMKWIAAAAAVRKANIRVYADCVRLSRRMAADGRVPCILKGQGNALMYPDAFSRSPGDIDVWLQGSALEIARYARRYVPGANVEYHHVDFPVFRHTPVEIHFVPSFMGNLLHERRLNRYFADNSAGQFSHKVRLPEDIGGEICTPTDGFNRIFQLTHIMHHFFFEGIGMRQVVDYYYLLRRGFSDVERAADVAVIKRLGMSRFAAALMYVLHSGLGLGEEYLLVEPDEKVGRLLLSEIMQAGNFGFHDARYDFKGIPLWKQYLLETRRNLRFALHFPSETVWGRPLSRFYHAYYKWRLRKLLDKH